MPKSCGWGGVVVVAHVILVSAQGPNPFFFFFGGLLFDLGACWDQDLDQGLTIHISLLSLIQGAWGVMNVIQALAITKVSLTEFS